MALRQIFLGDAIGQRAGVPDLQPTREDMDAHTTGGGAVVTVGQGVDECLANRIFRVKGGVLSLGIASDEAGNAGRVADNEGVSLLEDAVERPLKGLHVAKSVAGLVGIIAHGPDADLRQADGGVAGKEHVAAVGKAAVFGRGEVFQHHERRGGVAEEGAPDFHCICHGGVDFFEFNISLQISE